MATYHKTLKLIASKLGLGNEDKVINKAAEFERLLQTKSVAGNVMTDTSKTVICLDLASAVYGVDVDNKTAIKYSGLKGPSYANCRKVVENLLELNSDKLSISLLCASLQCSGVQSLAEKILEEYQRVSKTEIDLNLPQYVCMAVFQACRVNKIKISKSKIIEKSRLKPVQWARLDADWTKVVNEKFTTVKKRGRLTKTDKNDGNAMEIDTQKAIEEKPTEPQIEPYEDWKRRMLETAYKELKETESKKKELNNEMQEKKDKKIKEFTSPRRSPRKTPQKFSPYKSPRKPNNGTNIKHPYQLQMRDEDSDDDTYMGYRYTTCPDCEREIPNEPTKKEFAEMMREANQRVLKAMKISYWRQYEHGKISKDGVRTLVQAVEVAADADDARVNLDQLAALWRPKAHAVWLRRKLVDMLMPDPANAQVPRHEWRQSCYRLVSNVWFDGFIYVMILCNTPVILCEVLMKPPVSLTLMITIKSLNLFFYIIYVFEMVVKMLALTIGGYFKSHWNKLDFAIIVMATGDLFLDVIDALTPWDKWNNLNSSVLTATKLLRMLRFLRLCKLARVSVPKIMAYIDRMIDIQLAFGYDVGKGFVTGEQEVCSLLPQLVDNQQIQETLYNKLETDRLAVTRQLGLLQRDRPWTAITVKTRQATTSTLNIMILDTMQLKEEGYNIKFLKMLYFLILLFTITN